MPERNNFRCGTDQAKHVPLTFAYQSQSYVEFACGNKKKMPDALSSISSCSTETGWQNNRQGKITGNWTSGPRKTMIKKKSRLNATSANGIQVHDQWRTKSSWEGVECCWNAESGTKHPPLRAQTSCSGCRLGWLLHESRETVGCS